MFLSVCNLTHVYAMDEIQLSIKNEWSVLNG